MLDHSGYHEFNLDYSSAKRLAVGQAVHSELLVAGGYSWRMTCRPHGEHEDDAQTEFLSVYLELMSKAVGARVRAIFDVFLMSREGVPSSLFMKRCVRMYPPGCRSTLWGFRRFVDWKDLEDYCFVKDDGRVTLMWAVVVVNPAPTISVPPSDMGTHLGSLLLDGAVGTDVSFVVDSGEAFRAHRALLAARSPVFKAELFGLMMEAKASSVVVHDIEPETFKAMLVFMYTDSLPSGDVGTEMFQSLLVAADRYALGRLKLLCAQKLLDNVSMDTLTTMIDFAETYNCPELKNKCVEFATADGKFNKFGLGDDECCCAQAYWTFGIFACIFAAIIFLLVSYYS